MKDKVIRIALIGPESSGKSTLAKDLAQYYGTVYVEEYARTFIASLERPYNYEDVLHCIEEQERIENSALTKANRILFADTEIILHKVWLEDVFKANTSFLEEKIIQTKYDLYLLTKPDLPFITDPVRENPHRREYFFSIYEKELATRNFPYVIIEGKGKARLDNAIKAVNDYLNT